jgi:hypothetical protein
MAQKKKITSKPSPSRRWRPTTAAEGVAPPRQPPIKKTSMMMSARKSAPGTGGMKLRRKCKKA